jgi:hypothetical protein
MLIGVSGCSSASEDPCSLDSPLRREIEEVATAYLQASRRGDIDRFRLLEITSDEELAPIPGLATVEGRVTLNPPLTESIEHEVDTAPLRMRRLREVMRGLDQPVGYYFSCDPSWPDVVIKIRDFQSPSTGKVAYIVIGTARRRDGSLGIDGTMFLEDTEEWRQLVETRQRMYLTYPYASSLGPLNDEIERFREPQPVQVE